MPTIYNLDGSQQDQEPNPNPNPNPNQNQNPELVRIDKDDNIIPEAIYGATLTGDLSSLVAMLYVLSSKFQKTLQEILNYKNEDGITALEIAIQQKDLLAFSHLITAGANVNIESSEGFSILHLVVISDDLYALAKQKMLRKALEAGADITQDSIIELDWDRKEKVMANPLLVAALRGKADVAIEIMDFAYNKFKKSEFEDIIDKSKFSNFLSIDRRVERFLKNVIKSKHPFALKAFDLLLEANPNPKIKDKMINLKLEYEVSQLKTNHAQVEEVLKILNTESTQTLANQPSSELKMPQGSPTKQSAQVPLR